MIMKKGFYVFVIIFVIVSSNACMACFSEDDHIVHTGITGTQFVKDCVCDKEGYSVKHLTWLDPDGNAIQPNGPGTTSSNVYTEIPQDGVVRLIVRSISQSMAGTYTCQTNFEGQTYNKTYKIEAYENLYFVNTSENQNAVIGEDSLIRCEVRSNTNHEVYMVWYRLTGTEPKLLNDTEKYIFQPEQGLVIKNVSKDDGGSYVCTVNDVTEGDTEDVTINVQIAVRPKIYDVTFSVPPDSIVSGNNVTVECVAEGTPYPDYYWLKIADALGYPIEYANSTWTQNLNAITFENIQKDDAGTYECTAENTVDDATRHIVIEVKVPPEITSLDNVTAVEGTQTQIVCKATGVPTPGILMWHSVEGLDNDGRISSVVKNTNDTSQLYLSIMNVSRTFEGIYLCSADNGVDNVTQEMYLSVLYKPYFPLEEETVWGWAGKTVNMSCDHESNPPSTIVWKFQGNEIEHETTTAEHVQVNKILQEQSEDISAHGHLVLTLDNMTMYGEYECTASNDHGTSTKRIHLREAFKPEAIRNATVINTSATSVTFLIQGSDAVDNAPVNGYTAEYDLIENYNIKSVHRTRTCGLDRNFTIDRLRPNSTYSIKFAAQNEAGVGVWSDFLEFVTPETSAPEPPILIAVQGNHGKLRWKAPEANGDPIDHYSVEFCPFFGQVINTTLCQTETVSDTEFALDKLDRNTKYSFEIRAHNSHGYSDFTYEEITTPEKLVSEAVLSAGAIIGLSVVVVFLCLLVLDLLLLCWRRQGIIASCYFRKNKKKKTDSIQSRDKKGLLVREGADDSLTRPNNGHRELVYNKTTGVITGKHSTV